MRQALEPPKVEAVKNAMATLHEVRDLNVNGPDDMHDRIWKSGFLDIEILQETNMIQMRIKSLEMHLTRAMICHLMFS